jgi:hypothetical protein
MSLCHAARRRALVFAALVWLLAAIVLAGCGRAEYSLVGQVLDELTGQPLPNAQVAIGRHGVQTGAEGGFSLALREGSHQLQATLAGYVTQPFTVTVSAEAPAAEAEVRLARRTLVGTLVDAQTNTPVSGATVRLGDATAQSDAQGAFAVEALTIAPLEVAAPGYLPAELILADVESYFARTGAMKKECRILLTSRVLTGTVTDAATGSPLPGVPVATALGATETAADGSYALPRVEPGAVVSFGGTAHRTVEIPYEGQATQDAALEPWQASITVTDADDGAPLAGVTVQAGDQAVVTDAAGTAALQDVRPGTSITLSRDGYREVPIAYAGDLHLDVTLQRSLLQGTLAAADGTPVANGLIQVFTAGDGPQPVLVRSDAEGQFVLEDVSDVVSVTVKAPGYRRVTLPVEDPTAVDVSLEPFQFRGVYVPFGLLPLPDMVTDILDLVEETGMTGIVVDVKGDRARLAWDSQVPLAKEVEAYSSAGMDLKELVDECHRRGIYVVGRIVVFKDEVLGKARPDLAVKRASGELYADNEGLAWVDPFRPEVRDYMISLAVEVAGLGVDEIQLDYLRFPSDGSGILGLVYSQEANFETRTVAMAEFCAAMYEAVSRTPAFLSADIFGLTPFVDSSRDMGIGQRVDDIAPSMDYLSPMAYPTTYAPGTLGFDNPGREPYEFVYRTVMALRKRTTTAVRPWLQYYSIGGIRYDTFEFLEQRKGAEDAGSLGWIWWNSRGVYTPDAFYPDAIANTPGLSSPPPMD